MMKHNCAFQHPAKPGKIQKPKKEKEKMCSHTGRIMRCASSHSTCALGSPRRGTASAIFRLHWDIWFSRPKHFPSATVHDRPNTVAPFFLQRSLCCIIFWFFVSSFSFPCSCFVFIGFHIVPLFCISFYGFPFSFSFLLLFYLFLSWFYLCCICFFCFLCFPFLFAFDFFWVLPISYTLYFFRIE